MFVTFVQWQRSDTSSSNMNIHFFPSELDNDGQWDFVIIAADMKKWLRKRLRKSFCSVPGCFFVPKSCPIYLFICSELLPAGILSIVCETPRSFSDPKHLPLTTNCPSSIFDTITTCSKKTLLKREMLSYLEIHNT